MKIKIILIYTRQCVETNRERQTVQYNQYRSRRYKNVKRCQTEVHALSKQQRNAETN